MFFSSHHCCSSFISTSKGLLLRLRMTEFSHLHTSMRAIRCSISQLDDECPFRCISYPGESVNVDRWLTARFCNAHAHVWLQVRSPVGTMAGGRHGYAVRIQSRRSVLMAAKSDEASALIDWSWAPGIDNL